VPSWSFETWRIKDWKKGLEQYYLTAKCPYLTAKCPFTFFNKVIITLRILMTFNWLKSEKTSKK
jgi:hypothetical protein